MSGGESWRRARPCPARPARVWRRGSCVATPVGQRLVWQISDWMQPSANMKPRAALHQSAPSASMRAMSNALTTLPARRSGSRRAGPRPTSVLCTSSRPSRSGTPTWSMNSSGAAPVPPSAPSTTMKSGMMPVSRIALTIAMNSQGWPTQSLKPDGLAARELAQLGDEMHHLERRREGAVARRRDAVAPIGDAARRRRSRA